MNSLASSMILATAFLVSLGATNIADADPTCNLNKYDPGSSLEANVLTVLESMRTATANADDRIYTVQLPSPNVLGISTCPTDITIEDCISCLNDSVDEIKQKCPGSIEATNNHDDCNVLYAEQ